MATLTKFSPPANIGDFDQNPSLKDDWNDRISDMIKANIESLSTFDGVHPDQVCFFDPREQPPGQSKTVPVMWRGFPNILIAKYGKEEAYKIADAPGTLLSSAEPP